MALSDDLARIATVAAAFAEPPEALAGVIAAEPSEGERTYLCAYVGSGGARSWVALDEAGEPVASRSRVRDAVSIAAMCELAEETAGGGKLEELRAQLLELRLTVAPPGIEEAEEAALALEAALGTLPRVATPAHLDSVGTATRRLERALGDEGRSPFAEAMRQGVASIEALIAEVEVAYKLALP